MTPVEQIDRIIDISFTGLTEDFKARVYEVLNTPIEYVYTNGILKPIQTPFPKLI